MCILRTRKTVFVKMETFGKNFIEKKILRRNLFASHVKRISSKSGHQFSEL